MIRGKYYIKMIALGLVIGIVLALAGIFGGQLYHKTMAEKCIDKYNETHDIAVLADGFYHVSFCNDNSQTVKQQFLFYTKELADCGEWNSYYPHSKYGQKNGDTVNPELSMKLAYLQLTLLYGKYDEYIEGFARYSLILMCRQKLRLILYFAMMIFLKTASGSKYMRRLLKAILH